MAGKWGSVFNKFTPFDYGADEPTSRRADEPTSRRPALKSVPLTQSALRDTNKTLAAIVQFEA